jgi:phosphopantothenoylcysteine decarboxylase/phosphopantothenate--cysteine ligase
MYPVGDDLFGHLTPGQTGDALLVCPATANTLAKLAHGLADDMLSCQALAFSATGLPLLVAPAMNPNLWDAPATKANWETLLKRGVIGIGPGSGGTACGDQGTGRLADLREIVLATLKALSPQDMAGQRILITLGPTRECWDAVRFWSNPSTGTMGAALAVAAWLRGAEVTAVCGPMDLWLPGGIQRMDVITAREMHAAATDLWSSIDLACCTAAVADFRPVPLGTGKFKKAGQDSLRVDFEANPDILADLGRTKTGNQRLIGFAAETPEDAGSLAELAKGKLEAKNLDFIVANDIAQPGSGFATPTNRVMVLGQGGQRDEWPTLPKTEVAWRIWDLVSAS